MNKWAKEATRRKFAILDQWTITVYEYQFHSTTKENEFEYSRPNKQGNYRAGDILLWPLTSRFTGIYTQENLDLVLCLRITV